MKIDVISLRRLLPKVFLGMESSERLRRSEVWLNDDLTIGRGCRLCIQAESGSGKSSLLSFIYGNRNDYQGEIVFGYRSPELSDDVFQDTRLYDTTDWCSLRRNHLALLPQEMRLFPELTVMQNLELKNSLTHHKSDSQLRDMLERLGIADKADSLAGRLSIGQQQRVALIRAVCQPFDFIMLDEPVSHLDRANNLIAAAIIDEEAASQGAGVITTSVGNPLLLPNAQSVSL